MAGLARPRVFIDGIPQDLRAIPRWICWCAERRGDKMTKIPKDPRTGGNAKSTDPSTWADFDTAVRAWNQGRGRFDGIGFIFGEDRAYTGLDLDHVLTPGSELMDEYRWVVEEAGTYTEVSPSGDGLHLIFRGPKPEGATRCRRTQPGGKQVVEMYDHDRFFTVTGNRYSGTDPVPPVQVNSNPGALERAYRVWIDGGQQPSLPTAQQQARAYYDNGAQLDDEQVIEAMRRSRNGAQIMALMSGDTSAQGGDDSAADLALCNHLAFWCGKDEGQMDRIFRSSGLMRDKWDTRRGSTTYGQQTIARAIEGCTDVYKPRRARKQAAAQGKAPQACNVATDKNACSMPPAATRDEDSFDEDSAPSFDGWHVDERGRLWQVDGEGQLRYTVTSTPPWIARDLYDLDTADVRALVRLRVANRTRERAMARDQLLNQTRIISVLAPLGGNVTSTNAKDVVRYLTDCEKRYGGLRPHSLTVAHMGWAGKPLAHFMPYEADARVRFDPTQDQESKSRPFLEPKGTLADWVAGMTRQRATSPAFRTMLAASFASVLVAVVDVQTFIVYLWGPSRGGKTPSLKAAGSVWGDPTESADGYFRTFADTPKAIIRAATLLHDIPVIIDELQSKGSPGGQVGKRQIVEDLLYSLSLGHERGALNSDRSMMRAGSWRSLTIATGEIPIVGDNTQQGAANRTLEINAKPFATQREAQEMHHLVAEQHGTAGRAFVAALRTNDRAWYRDQYKWIRSQVDEFSGGHPQTDNIALLTLADALAELYVFSPGACDWELAVGGALTNAYWLVTNATDADGGDTDLKAIQYVADWLSRNEMHFSDTCEDDRLERYGAIEQHKDGLGFDWLVISSALTEALNRGNYDRTKTLARMFDEGIVAAGTKGYVRQRRIGESSHRTYCVVIDNNALEKFVADHALRLTGSPKPGWM